MGENILFSLRRGQQKEQFNLENFYKSSSQKFRALMI